MTDPETMAELLRQARVEALEIAFVAVQKARASLEASGDCPLDAQFALNKARSNIRALITQEQRK